jgi:hypothetical protein
LGYNSGASGSSYLYDNTICINASSTTLNSLQSSSLYIDPIRNTNTSGSKLLGYDATNKEVIYSDEFDATVDSLTMNDTILIKSVAGTNVSIGRNSQNVAQTLNCVSIGNTNGNQSNNNIAIGVQTGHQSTDAICIGTLSCYGGTAGHNAWTQLHRTDPTREAAVHESTLLGSGSKVGQSH